MRCIFRFLGGIVANPLGDICLEVVEYVDDERGIYANSSR